MIINMLGETVTISGLNGQEFTLPSEGKVEVVEKPHHLVDYDYEGDKIPVFVPVYGVFIEPPAHEPGKYYLVPKIVLDCYPERSDLFAPCEVIFKEDGKIDKIKTLFTVRHGTNL